MTLEKTPHETADRPKGLAVSLFIVRVTFGLFLLAWAVNKVVNPGSVDGILQSFYGAPAVGAVIARIIGGLQIVICFAIIGGVAKTWSYGAGLLMHAASVAVILPHLILPLAEGSNLLFMAALPVLGAAIALFIMRRENRFLSF